MFSSETFLVRPSGCCSGSSSFAAFVFLRTVACQKGLLPSVPDRASLRRQLHLCPENLLIASRVCLLTNRRTLMSKYACDSCECVAFCVVGGSCTDNIACNEIQCPACGAVWCNVHPDHRNIVRIPGIRRHVPPHKQSAYIETCTECRALKMYKEQLSAMQSEAGCRRVLGRRSSVPFECNNAGASHTAVVVKNSRSAVYSSIPVISAAAPELCCDMMPIYTMSLRESQHWMNQLQKDISRLEKEQAFRKEVNAARYGDRSPWRESDTTGTTWESW